jgi:hypothetical protein
MGAAFQWHVPDFTEHAAGRRSCGAFQYDHLYTGQGRPVARIDVTPMTYGNMTDYALKSFKNAREDGTDILIMPRSRSEMGFNN